MRLASGRSAGPKASLSLHDSKNTNNSKPIAAFFFFLKSGKVVSKKMKANLCSEMHLVELQTL